MPFDFEAKVTEWEANKKSGSQRDAVGLTQHLKTIIEINTFEKRKLKEDLSQPLFSVISCLTKSFQQSSRGQQTPCCIFLIELV